jgi:hypothetical protein
MSDYVVTAGPGIKIPKYVSIELPSGNIVKVKNGTDANTLNKIGGELIDLSFTLLGKNGNSK